MPEIKWLHVSDLHIGRDEANSRLVRESFIADWTKQGFTPDFVVFTGDLAYAGKAKEYRQATLFLDSILNVSGLSRDRMIIVPGNHDVDWVRISRLANGANSQIESRESLRAVVEDKSDFRLLTNRQAHFREFLQTYYAGLANAPQISPYFGLTHFLALPSGSIRVLGLNSAWLSRKSGDRNALVIGEPQLVELTALKPPTPPDVTIAVMHHPLEWLKPFDQSDMQEALEAKCDLVLHGHLHQSGLRLTKTPDADCMYIAAGALYEHREYPNGYNYVSLDPRARTGTVTLRRYQDRGGGGFFTADTQTYRNAPNGTYHFELAVQNKATPQKRSVEHISRQLTHRLGNKRTAYPRDMSFRELYERSVFVEPTYIPAYDPASGDALAVEALVRRLCDGSNILLLGDPGAGKSFLSYLVQRNIDIATDEIIPLPVDLRLLRDDLQRDKATINRLLNALCRDAFGVKTRVAVPATRLLFLVDGLDEVATSAVDPATVAAFVKQLTSWGNVLATCRREDYESLFATHLDTASFDDIYVLRDWQPAQEFAQFVEKLHDAGLLADARVADLVVHSTTLSTLVRRPLHARMLTFVLADMPTTRLQDLSELYNSYLEKYGVTVDHQLQAHDCVFSTPTFIIWRDIAWFVFEHRLLERERIPLPEIEQFVTESSGSSPACVTRLLDALFDRFQAFGLRQLEFIHYSFYEFLVADHLAEALVRSSAGAPRDLVTLLRHDLPPEMRHHLLRILKRIKPAGFAKWLATSYSEHRGTQGQDAEVLTANNLLLYVLGRLGEDITGELKDLLRDEQDGFLRTSLYWALSGIGAADSLAQYLGVLQEDHQMAQLNRGYLLYYYGDLERSQLPPYLDTTPYVDWTNTKRRTIQMMGGVEYEGVGEARRLLDVYTFLDFYHVRNESLDDEAKAICRHVLESIKSEGLRQARGIASYLTASYE